MKYRLKDIDIHSATEVEIQDLINIAQRITTIVFPEDPVEPDEIVKKQLLVQLDPKELILHGYLIYENYTDNPIGFCFYGWFTEGSIQAQGNEMVSFIEIQIDPDYRNKGIGSELLNQFVSKIKETGRKIVIINTMEEAGKSFLENSGFQFALIMPIFRTKFIDINWTMIEKWKEEGERINPETELRIYDTFPEDIINEYSTTYTKTHEQIPMQDLQIQDREYTPEYLRELYDKGIKMGQERLTAVAIEKSGEIAGFSYFSYSKTREPIIDQGITAVLEKHRGKKLGKWLKAVMLLEAKSKYPNITPESTQILQPQMHQCFQ